MSEEFDETNGDDPRPENNDPVSTETPAAPATTKTKRTKPKSSKGPKASGANAKASGTKAKVKSTKAEKPKGPEGPAPIDYEQAFEAALSFKQLAERARIQIMDIISREDITVGALATRLKTTQPALSHHLMNLRNIRAVRAERRGKEAIYRLTPFGKSLLSIIRKVIEFSAK